MQKRNGRAWFFLLGSESKVGREGRQKKDFGPMGCTDSRGLEETHECYGLKMQNISLHAKPPKKVIYRILGIITANLLPKKKCSHRMHLRS